MKCMSDAQIPQAKRPDQHLPGPGDRVIRIVRASILPSRSTAALTALLVIRERVSRITSSHARGCPLTSTRRVPTQPGADEAQAPKVPRGRPRHPEIDDQVLDATLAVLSEEGFAATTIAAVARRSGTHSSAIYRRWPSRIALIEEAVFPGFDEMRISPTGDLRGDVRQFMEAYERTLSSPAARAAMPGLLASYQGGASPHPAQKWLRVSARPHFRDILQAAGPAERRFQHRSGRCLRPASGNRAGSGARPHRHRTGPIGRAHRRSGDPCVAS